MPERLEFSLDSDTVQRLEDLGRDLLRSPERRRAFLEDRDQVLASFQLENVDLSQLDEQVLDMLSDPAFDQALESGDIESIRGHVRTRLASRPSRAEEVGVFDFDVEVEVEAVVVAIVVFDVVLVKTRVPTEAELTRRRAIVADALEAVRRRAGE